MKREFPLITLPVLILHGTLDKVTRPSGSQLFYDMAGSVDKTLKLYEGYYHDLLHDIVEQVQGTTTTHHLTCTGHIAAPVLGDRDRLGQVFINLLSNAIKYSPEADTVIIPRPERAAPPGSCPDRL